MPAALTYSSYVAELANLSEFNATDPNFVTNLPHAINYAEDRINRELNLLSTVTSNHTLSLTPGSRVLDLTPININVLSQINIITPSTEPNPELGTRNVCIPTTKAFLDAVYNSGSAGDIEGLPVNFAMLTDKVILFGPFPNAAYTVEVTGTIWVPPLSSANNVTWISTYLPELFLAASMVQMSGFMRVFGSQSDDPQMAVSWETTYSSLRDSASAEEARRKFQSSGWTSQLPSPTTPPRT